MWTWCTSEPFTCIVALPSSTLSLHRQSSLCTHTYTHSLEGDPLPASPHSFWAACSVGTMAWMNDLEISLFQMTGVRKWSCESGPLCFPRFIHKKKKSMHMGKGKTEVWPHPAHSSYHPHARDSTNVTSCLCHRADCIVVSDWLWLSAFPLPLFISRSSLPLPHAIFSFFSSLPLSSSLFVLFSWTTKGRQSEGWRHPSSLWPFKKKAPRPAHSSTWIDNTHTHINLHKHTHRPFGSTHSFTLASNFLLQKCPCAHCEASSRDPLLSHTHMHKHTHTQNRKTWLPSFINGSLGGFLTDTRSDIPLASWLTATTQIPLPKLIDSEVLCGLVHLWKTLPKMFRLPI